MPTQPPTHRPVAYVPYDKRQKANSDGLKRPSAAARGYGWKWQQIRKAVLREQPICAWANCHKLSQEVDHIIPKSKGGTDDRCNLQGLCKSHHSTKSSTQDGGGWGGRARAREWAEDRFKDH